MLTIENVKKHKSKSVYGIILKKWTKIKPGRRISVDAFVDACKKIKHYRSSNFERRIRELNQWCEIKYIEAKNGRVTKIA